MSGGAAVVELTLRWSAGRPLSPISRHSCYDGVVRVLVFVSCSLAPLALACCNPSAETVSLVGAPKPPPLAYLERETIIIGRSAGSGGNDTLNIEVRPNNNILIAAYRKGNLETPAAREELQLSSAMAEGLRRMLWRLRPEDGASAQNSVPIGCRYVYDAGSMWSVTFVRAGDPVDMVVFELPYPEYCKTPAYREAKQLIEQVLEALPRSEVVRRFPAGRYRALGT